MVLCYQRVEISQKSLYEVCQPSTVGGRLAEAAADEYPVSLIYLVRRTEFI